MQDDRVPDAQPEHHPGPAGERRQQQVVVPPVAEIVQRRGANGFADVIDDAAIPICCSVWSEASAFARNIIASRQWYDRASRWGERNEPGEEELLRFRAEAEALLRPADRPKPAGQGRRARPR